MGSQPVTDQEFLFRLHLHEAMLAANVTAADLARRLTDIFKPAQPDEIERALAALGLQMISEASPLQQWAPSPDPAPAA